MPKCHLCKEVEISYNYDLPRYGKPYTIWDVQRDRPHDCKFIDKKTGKWKPPEVIAGKDYDPKWYGGCLCWHCGCKHHLDDMLFFHGVPQCFVIPGYDCTEKYDEQQHGPMPTGRK